MRILVDAMGGDNAPDEIIKGAAAAAGEFDVDIVLVGREEEIRRCLGVSEGALPAHISLIHAEETISMEDDPSTATRRKKDSSMSVALQRLRDGEGDAVVSAGSTGALLTGATLIVKRIRGVRRACLSPVLPNGDRGVLLIDSGANVECTPEYLLQFAYMGSIYSQDILGIASPRVGLLNIGTEETKGTELQKQTFELLRRAREKGQLNFIGNTEARELFSGDVDVLVTDGFTGNVVLKTAEGAVTFLLGLFKQTLTSGTRAKLAAAMIRGDLKQLRTRLDVGEVGGTAMLGISKPVIKAHGSSDARAIRSAVAQAIRFIEAGVIAKIEENIEQYSL
jgi:glycerol-3-phosphate acyltransferase PlsX